MTDRMRMTLRMRLMLWIGAMLVATLLFSAVLVYWHAAQRVHVEMHAAIEVGAQTVRNAVDDGWPTVTPARQLRLLVSDFDGDRHLRVALVAADGSTTFRSMPLTPDEPAPRWFYRLLAAPPEVAVVKLPPPFDRYGSMKLTSDSHNEIAEVWGEVGLMFVALTTFCLLSAGLVHVGTGHALRPLNRILAAFERIGRGEYTQRVPETGPRELERLARGFNGMAERLAGMEARKRRLEEQIVEVQEEERAELARDLHDEMGPLLFAIGVDLVALRQYAAEHASRDIAARLDSTRESLSRIQHQVRGILERLRPPSMADLGLAHSIEHLVSFWRVRYPAVRFEVTAPQEGVLDADMALRVYRIVQESLNNALRHGKPRHVSVRVSHSEDVIVVEVSDDGVGMRAGGSRTGLGLTGMRERVDVIGGELRISEGPGGRGVNVLARLPAQGAAARTQSAALLSERWA